MEKYRNEARQADAALRGKERIETRRKRRIVKRLLERNARWRRLVAGGMAAGMAAALGSLLMVGEAAAMAL